MTQGRLLWYSYTIDYGFLHPNEGGEKILVPRTGISGTGPRSLENGAKVIYETIQGKEGMEAKNVSKEPRRSIREPARPLLGVVGAL
jgi:cold shock protein